MKLLKYILIGILVGCHSSLNSVDKDQLDISSIISTIPPYGVYYTFSIENDGCEGKAFIAGNKIHSARHIFNHQDYISLQVDDYQLLGDSNIHGLNICHEKHDINDRFSCFVQSGYVKMFLRENLPLFLRVDAWPIIISGDSGTPVLCDKHNAVVGIISGTVQTGDTVLLSKIHD